MSKSTYRLENHKTRFPSHRLSTENFGRTHDKTWPFTWCGHDGEFHHYTVKTGWKIIGTSQPPFPSKCEGNTRAVVVEFVETGEIYWWHFTKGEVLIHKSNFSE
jgi:hypothetical protein